MSGLTREEPQQIDEAVRQAQQERAAGTDPVFATAYEAWTGSPYSGGMNRAERRRWEKRHLSRRARRLVKKARESRG